MALFYFVGQAPPSDFFAGHASRVWAEVTVQGNTPAGTPAWVTAQWQNPRGHPGPAAQPIRACLQFGLTSPAMAA